MKILQLKTDNVFQPLGIDNRLPLFSWQISGEGTIQADYRIIVGTSLVQVASGEPDMWDSTIIKSNVSLQILYNGKPLKSCTRYYWAVESGVEKSEISWFETAFLDSDTEFIAEWIGMPLGFGGATDAVRFDFTIDKAVKSCRFYLAALGMGRAYINGALLDDAYFDGSVSVYHKTIYYRTYALDLRQGKNALCVELGYGFYGAKKMYGILRTEFEDGSVSITPTFAGRSWNVKRGSVVAHALYDGENYDARTEEDWLNPDYTVSFGNWVATFAADMPRGKLKACPIPPMKIVETFKPKSTKTLQDDSILVDTGKNLCGFLTVTVKGDRGAKVTMQHAERLLPSGELDLANLRAAVCEDSYILKGEGDETYTPQFTYHGFQFARLTLQGNAIITDIKVNYLRSAVDCAGTFTCSDKTINQLHDIAVQTDGNNLNGVFTDCPQRDERLGWLNDLSSRMFASVCNFSLEKYLPNFVDMISETQKEDGSIPDTVPFYVGSQVADPISAYTLLGKLSYEIYGDKQILSRNYNYFERWIDCLKSKIDPNEQVLNFALYGDWCPAKIYATEVNGGTYSAFVPTSFMSGSYFLWYLRQMQQIAQYLDKPHDIKRYSDDFNRYKLSFDKKYYNKKTGLYGNGHQTECAIAMTVFYDDEQGKKRWAKAAANDIIRRGYHMTCGNQGYRHLMYNLAENGYAEEVVKMLKNPEYPGWGFMLSRGATSVWERWEDKVGSDMHSFNHPMFAGYDGFFYNFIAGIRLHANTSAFSEIEIEPCFIKELSFAKATYNSVRGKIACSWKRESDGSIALNVSTPGNTSLVVRAKGRTIVYNGKSYSSEVKLINGIFNFQIFD